jgi:hypothetical protein
MAQGSVTIPLQDAPAHARELDVRQLVTVAWAMGIPTDRKSLEEIRASVEAWPNWNPGSSSVPVP